MTRVLRAVLAAGLFAPLAATAQPAERGDSVGALQAAQRRIEALGVVSMLYRETLETTSWLDDTTGDLRTSWRELPRALAAAETSQLPNVDCLDGLRAYAVVARKEWAPWSRSIELSHRAALGAEQQPTMRSAASARRMESSYRLRQQREQTLLTKYQDLINAANRCSETIPHSAAMAAEDKADFVVGNARDLPAQLQELDTNVRQLRESANTAARQGWLSAELPSQVHLEMPALEALATAAGQISTVKGEMHLSLDAYQVSGAARKVIDKIGLLGRARDGLLYMQLVAASCSGPYCRYQAVVRAEQGRRAQTVVNVMTALDAAHESLMKRITALEDLTSTKREALAKAAAVQGIAEATVQSALEIAEMFVSAARTTVKAIGPDLDRSVRDAWSIYEQGFVAAYGTRPEVPDALLSYLPKGPGNLPGGSGQELERVEITGGIVGAGLGISGHAYQAIFANDEEHKGFGAYTYVLFSSAPELETAESRERYRVLIETIRRLTTPGRAVDERDRLKRNLFCIPASADRNAHKTTITYDPLLGDQLKIRTQSRVLIHREMLARLARSAGPFLLTFPTRLTQATPDTAMLFADLSEYPAGAIADLAEQYMSGLLDGFAERPSQWKPPTAQRVALWMIQLGRAANTIAFRAIPAGTAAAQDKR